MTKLIIRDFTVKKDVAVLGLQLDLILRVFSNLYHSMILHILSTQV